MRPGTRAGRPRHLSLRNAGSGRVAGRAPGARWLLAAALVAAGAPAPLTAAAQGDADTSGSTPREGPRVIRDPRLEADSTLFPYEWAALVALQGELRAVRQALENDAVEELARAAPAVAQAAERVASDTVPALLAPRAEELRGRMVALRGALAEAAGYAEAALAAPPLLEGGWAPGDTGFGAAAAPAPEGLARLPPTPAGAEVAPPAPGPPLDGPAALGDTTAPGDTAGGLETDPRAAYLDSWRDVLLHADALVHALRDPAREPDPAPPRPPQPETTGELDAPP